MQFQGERVTIRSTACKDLLVLMGLWNDGRVMRWVGKPDGLGYGADDVHTWFQKLQGDPSRRHFVVHSEGIGFCGELYYAVDAEHRRASLDCKFRSEAQGRGLAAEAFRWLIKHVFETESNVDTVWTEPSDANIAGCKLCARCGLEPRPRPRDLPSAESFWALSRDKWNSS